MLCDEVTALLPGMVDGDATSIPRPRATSRRACAARPSSPATAGCSARSRCCAPATRSRRRDCSARRSPRSPTPPKRALAARLLSGRRLAYAGAIGGTAVAAGATAALLIARSRKRSLRLAG